MVKEHSLINGVEFFEAMAFGTLLRDVESWVSWVVKEHSLRQ